MTGKPAENTGDKAWITWTYKPIFDEVNNLKEVLCIVSTVPAEKDGRVRGAAAERKNGRGRT